MDESIFVFSRISFSKFSLKALYIYSRVREECEDTFSAKQGILATYSFDWIELQV